MRKILLFLIVFVAAVHLIAQRKAKVIFDRKTVIEHLPTPGYFKPIPQAKDSFWRNAIPQEMRSDYIRSGYSFHGKTWDSIPDSVFSEYRTIGNRSNYERLSFGLRRQMLNLVLGEIMEYKGQLIEDILKGLDYFIHETWWGSSAHYPKPLPDANNQVVDLFNAETSSLLAWTIYMLGDELEKTQPGITKEIKCEIDRRFLTPARTIGFQWKNKVDNWNSWICANWLSCILLCEDDRRQQIKDIEEVLTSLEFFYNGYHNDGGCEEGANYWDRAAASLYESIRLVELATDVKSSLADDPKFKAMGSFIYKYYIGDNVYVNFADAPSNTQVNINILYPFGKYIGDTIMTGFAALIARDANYKQYPTKLLLKSRNSPSLSRELLFLYDYESFEKCKPRAPFISETWMPELQVLTARSNIKTHQGFFIAAKGGHNGEKHNHNDIGSFVVYYDSEPLLIDLGGGTYTAQTFSSDRYELMNCRSAYHNVPIINGFEQHEGLDYCATNVNHKFFKNRSIFALNIESAYPKEAEIEKWERKIILNRGKNVTVSESFKLNMFKAATELVLISCGDTQLSDNGCITISTGKDVHFIKFNSNQLSPMVEILETDDKAILNAWKNMPLYRIRLVVRGNKKKCDIKYSIQ